MVLSAELNHEIATHTFSHIVVGDPDCDRDIFRSQLAACKRLHDGLGLPFASIVYPRNRVAFVDVLPEFGITSYRGRQVGTRGGGVAGRALTLADRIAAPTPPTYKLPVRGDQRTVNLPASMLYSSRSGVRRLVPMRSRLRQARRGIREAAEAGHLFHLWFHPFNLSGDDELFFGLDTILRRVAEYREAGRLDVLTMQQTAERSTASAAL
ncbi:MAG: hypothetical protein ACRDFS_05060 [Chloroflexota bacterium]